MARQLQYRIKGTNNAFGFEGGAPGTFGVEDPAELEGLPETEERTVQALFDLYNQRPERKEALAQQAAQRDADFGVSPETGRPAPADYSRFAPSNVVEHPPQAAPKPAPKPVRRAEYAVSEGAKPDTSAMLARLGGAEPVGPEALAGAPSSIRGMVAQSMMGAAQPGQGAPYSPPRDREMEDAMALDKAAGIASRVSGSMEPLMAALRGGPERERDVANPRAAAELQMKRQIQEGLARRDPNNPNAARIAQMIAGDNPEVAAQLKGLSIEEMEKYAPTLVKRLEAQMQSEALAEQKRQARQDRIDAREDNQRHSEQMAAANRAAQIAAARISAGLGMDREVRAENRALAREDRAAERKKEAATMEIEERFRGADKALADMESMVNEDGTFETFGDHNALLEALVTSFSTDMAKLRDPDSVAREAEVALERRALGDFNRLGVRNQTALDIIRKTRERLAERRGEAYRVRGMDAPEIPSAPAAPRPGAAQQPQGLGRVPQSADDVKQMTEEELRAFLAQQGG